MERPFLLLSVLFIWASNQSAEAPMKETVDYPPMMMTTSESIELVDDIRDAIFELRFVDADVDLKRLWKRTDGMLAAVYHRSEIAMIQALLSDTAEDYEHFFAESNRLQELLRRSPMSAGVDYLKAESARQRMFVWAKKGDFMKAAIAMNASSTAFEELIESHPTYYEAYKGMGLMHMTLSALPEPYRGLLNFFGLSGTLQQGADELAIAADSSRFASKEAKLYLALLDRYQLPSSVEAETEMASFWRSYTGSPLIGLIYGDILLRNRKAAKAERVLREAIAFTEKPGVQGLDYLHFYLGESQFAQNDLTGARASYLRYDEGHGGTALKVRTYLRVGQSYELEHERQAALPWYQKIVVAREFEEDAAAGRMAQHLLVHPMDSTDRQLMVAHNLLNAGESEDARLRLESVYNSASSADRQRGEAAYRLGRMHHESGNIEVASIWYAIAAETPGDPKAKWAPWSLYYLAELARDQNNIESARRYVRDALHYQPDYDYKPGLQRLGRLLEQSISQANPTGSMSTASL